MVNKNKTIEFTEAISHTKYFPYVNVIKNHKLIAKITFNQRFQTLSILYIERIELIHEEINSIHEKLNELDEERQK